MGSEMCIRDRYFEGEQRAAAEHGADMDDFLQESIAQFRRVVLATGGSGRTEAGR